MKKQAYWQVGDIIGMIQNDNNKEEEMKGICFKEPLFHLTIQGIKKQTRRIIKSRTGFFQVCYKNGAVTNIWQTDANEWCGDNLIPVNPRYKVGETVYLKEPYCWDAEDEQILYKFDNSEKIVPFWENKLFMSASVARHFIIITAVRAERLQNISYSDCIKEGISFWGRVDDNSYYTNGLKNKYGSNVLYDTAQEAYAALIDSINGKGTWENNPWVWVYDYVLAEG